MTKGLPHSVQVRLVQHAKKLGIDPNVVLVRYASERFLYRLSRSPHVDRFVLKGALLLLVWLGETIRPTPGKTAQWNGFTRRLGSRVLPNLADVVDVIANFGGPVLLAVGRKKAFAQKWSAGGPWRPGSDA